MASNYFPPEFEELKTYLMEKPDYLGQREVKSIWDGLQKCVSTRNGHVTAAFEKLETAISHYYRINKEQLIKKKKYSILKASIIRTSEGVQNKGLPPGKPLVARGQQVTKAPDNKQKLRPLPQKEDDSASMALTRMCQLIKWLHGVLNGGAGAKPPVRQKDQQLNEPHTLAYIDAEKQILEVKYKFTELTKKLEENITAKAEESSELGTHSQQGNIEQQTPDDKPPHQIDREHYESIIQDQTEQYDKQMMKMQKQIQTLNQEVHCLKEEKEGLMTRMSKMAGDKLTHNNPAITDLSDPNRPQKLGEKYGELYDNEWTDAIDKLNTKKEEKLDRSCIDFLLDILQFCYRECEQIADNNLALLETVCCSFQINNKQQRKLPEGSEAVKRNLLDAQHGASIFTRLSVVGIVKTSLANHKQLKDKAKKVSPYTEKCIEICWSMVTHHPRLVLLWPEDSKEKHIRFDVFQAYTRSGDTLDFVVWPAMLLHKDGPLLRKGTVQPVAK